MGEKIIFTIGRMNPPTSGHQGLIRKMMEKALEIGINRVYIILSGTVDDKKNPLTCKFKKELIMGNSKDVSSIVENLKRKWIDEKALKPEEIEWVHKCQVIIICMNDPDIDTKLYGTNPILKCIHYLIRNYESGKMMEKSFLFVGEDRGNDYGWISNSKNLGKLEIIPLERPEGAISATYIRNLAIDGKEEDFLGEMEKVGISRERGMEVYLEIRKALSTSELKKKNVTKKKNRITEITEDLKSMMSEAVKLSPMATTIKRRKTVKKSPEKEEEPEEIVEKEEDEKLTKRKKTVKKEAEKEDSPKLTKTTRTRMSKKKEEGK
jgi:nicotinic acid mononucleotide adenylyltransferase